MRARITSLPWGARVVYICMCVRESIAAVYIISRSLSRLIWGVLSPENSRYTSCIYFAICTCRVELDFRGVYIYECCTFFSRVVVEDAGSDMNILYTGVCS